MIDFHELMGILSVPRPNGSAAEQETCRALKQWLGRHSIPYRVHTFRVYPYFFECIGLWLLLSRTLLVLCVWWRRGWAALALALAGIAGGTLDVAFHWPLVSWFGARKAENLIMTFEPVQARQEIVFAAHYDSKTELLGRRQLRFLMQHLRNGLVLTLLVGLLGPVEGRLRTGGVAWSKMASVLGRLLAMPMLFLAWALGLNLAAGRLTAQSQGAVDNGAACAILLGLADRLAKGVISLQNTRVTIALFTGEEQNMQGSRAYVRSRAWALPATVVNLELMAQDGPYVIWQNDGDAFRRLPTTPAVNARLQRAVSAVTGADIRYVDWINSDGFRFLSAGIATGVLGTHDSELNGQGLHQSSDNLGRVVKARLPEAVDILGVLLEDYDREERNL